jgi:hypothetical protein
MSQPASPARPAHPMPSLEHSSITPADIDLPAFMRRRSR